MVSSGLENITIAWTTLEHTSLQCVSFCLVLCSCLSLNNVWGTVINPCIRFSWIENEWGHEYIAHAKRVILEVVSQSDLENTPLTTLIDQIGECNDRGGSTFKTPAQAPASPKKPAVPRFVSLPTKYKLQDHPIYPRATSAPSTAEDAFLKYKNGAMSPQDTDLIAFWEVCVVILKISLYSYFILDRSTDWNTRRFFASPWTIFPSKRLRFHVNMSSHRLEKRTQRGAIASHRR